MKIINILLLSLLLLSVAGCSNSEPEVLVGDAPSHSLELPKAEQALKEVQIPNEKTVEVPVAKALQPSQEEVIITEDHMFVPDRLVVARGSTVTFFNQDSSSHSITMSVKGKEVFGDKFFPTGSQFDETLDIVGTYYIDSLTTKSLEMQIDVK